MSSDDKIGLNEKQFQIRINIHLDPNCKEFQTNFLSKIVIKWYDIDNSLITDQYNVTFEVANYSEGLKSFKTDIIIGDEVLFSPEKTIFFQNYKVY
jgi:hypothetical protein